MPRTSNVSPEEQRRYNAVNKYHKVDGMWTIDTNHRLGSVRPIDLVSRGPDQLRGFETQEAAVAFEEECFSEKQRLQAAYEDWSEYRYIDRKKLTIPEDQRQLHDSLVGEIRVGNRDTTEAVTNVVNNGTDQILGAIQGLQKRQEEMNAKFDAKGGKGKGKGKGGRVNVYRRAYVVSGDDDEEDVLVKHKMDTGHYVYDCKPGAAETHQMVSEQNVSFRSLLNAKVLIGESNKSTLSMSGQKYGKYAPYKEMKGHITADPDPEQEIILKPEQQVEVTLTNGLLVHIP